MRQVGRHGTAQAPMSGHGKPQERKVAHIQGKNKEEKIHEKEFIHPSTKNIHTHAHLDQSL
jgi:hypothetical protein